MGMHEAFREKENAMSGMLHAATRDGVMSFATDSPGSPLALKGRGLEGKWVWLTCGGGDVGRAYAGTRTDGAFMTEDAGETWRPISTEFPATYVRGLAFTPADPHAVYLGTEPAGVFRFDHAEGAVTPLPMDGVKSFPTWSFPEPPHIAHVKDLTFDQRNPSSIYAAVEVGGVMRSDDGGLTWVELLDGIDTDTHFIAVDPHVEGRVYCATGISVYKSTDRGNHWQRISDPLSRAYTSLIVAHPTIPDRLYVAASDGPPPDWFTREKRADAVFFVSEDGGETFTEIHDGLPALAKEPYTSLVVDPRDTNVLYLSSGDGTIRVSDDLGMSWRVLIEGLPHVQHLTVAV